MSGNNGVSTVLGSFGGQLGGVNTARGVRNSDGTINISGTLQGIAAVAESQMGMFGKSVPGVQLGVGAWGVINVGLQVYAGYQDTGQLSINGAQLASLASNTVNIGMGVLQTSPVTAVAFTVGATVVEYGFNLYAGSTQGGGGTSSGSRSGFGGSTVQPGSMTSTAPNQGPGWGWGAITASSTAAQASSASATAAQAAAATQAAREALRASEIAYTNSQGGGGWNTSGGGNSGYGGSRVQAGSMTSTAPNQGPGYGGGGDPIVIDLDGDGVQLYSRADSPAHFDFDDDGYLEATAWAGPKDGILVIDEGGDNKITQSKEIAFAKWTAAEGDTDLQALAATFDSNRDGVLDVRDQRFGDFKVWKDANGNGAVDAGEMQTLAQAGIKSMNLLVKDGTGTNLEDGSVIHGLFDIQRGDGKTIQGADVSLTHSSQLSLVVDVAFEINALCNPTRLAANLAANTKVRQADPLRRSRSTYFYYRKPSNDDAWRVCA